MSEEGRLPLTCRPSTVASVEVAPVCKSSVGCWLVLYSAVLYYCPSTPMVGIGLGTGGILQLSLIDCCNDFCLNVRSGSFRCLSFE